MPTVIQKDYKLILKRQEKLEKELDILKQVVKKEVAEERINPKMLKRWERISRDLDRGKGHYFASVKEMKQWLRAL